MGLAPGRLRLRAALGGTPCQPTDEEVEEELEALVVVGVGEVVGDGCQVWEPLRRQRGDVVAGGLRRGWREGLPACGLGKLWRLGGV